VTWLPVGSEVRSRRRWQPRSHPADANPPARTRGRAPQREAMADAPKQTIGGGGRSVTLRCPCDVLPQTSERVRGRRRTPASSPPPSSRHFFPASRHALTGGALRAAPAAAALTFRACSEAVTRAPARVPGIDDFDDRASPPLREPPSRGRGDTGSYDRDGPYRQVRGVALMRLVSLRARAAARAGAARGPVGRQPRRLLQCEWRPRPGSATVARRRLRGRQRARACGLAPAHAGDPARHARRADRAAPPRQVARRNGGRHAVVYIAPGHQRHAAGRTVPPSRLGHRLVRSGKHALPLGTHGAAAAAARWSSVRSRPRTHERMTRSA
jgi:hypothetical protein